MTASLRGLLTLGLLAVTPTVVTAQEADPDPDRGLPLEPARWAEFTTSEGPWLSLDVSPDGETIVFEPVSDTHLTLPTPSP